MADDALLGLASRLGELFKSEQRILALAESCTGGLCSNLVTDIAGSSAWFDSGYITYSNQAKIEILGVSDITLKSYGAVSEQTAIEMALGCLRNGRVNIAASITGIAGPTGGTPDKPVGTVCFAWVGLGLPTVSKTEHFNGNRQKIREQSASTALQGLISLLQKK
ncbi:MAG TPA: CinA family protein [Methyloradius sp.]